ncbi:MAG: hypothetical protein IKU99_07260, partial [Clostridia bacterium]|nr:hypothetical protein [Clostridia bacterium]
MLQDKQIDRLVLKVQRLETTFAEFLVKKVISPKVTVTKQGKEVEAYKGLRWGKDFKCETFKFTAEGLSEGEKYYLFANTGSPEHQIAVNGKKVGMLDYITNAFEPPARTHRYLLLDGLKNGDVVTLEAYYSHPVSGLCPYDEPFTFSYATVLNDRPYEEIGLAVLDQSVKNFCERLSTLTKLYNSSTNRFEKAEIEKIYIEIFKTLPMEKCEPDSAKLDEATAI